MTDPIADLITRVRNGYLARQRQVRVTYSVLKESLAEILAKEGYLKKVVVEGKKPQEKELVLELRYSHQKPALTDIKRVSKPSLRIYLRAKELKPLRGGLETRILSTSQGLMTDREAKKKNLGGEVICQLW